MIRQFYKFPCCVVAPTDECEGQGCGKTLYLYYGQRHSTYQHECGLCLGQAKLDEASAPGGVCKSQNSCGAGQARQWKPKVHSKASSMGGQV